MGKKGKKNNKKTLIEGLKNLAYLYIEVVYKSFVYLLVKQTLFLPRNWLNLYEINIQFESLKKFSSESLCSCYS